MTTPRSYPWRVFAGYTPLWGPLFWPHFWPKNGHSSHRHLQLPQMGWTLVEHFISHPGVTKSSNLSEESWMTKYTNTNTQIHKYSLGQSCRKAYHVLYFGKGNGTSISKFPSVWCAHTNPQIHKNNLVKVAYRPYIQTRTLTPVQQ